MRWSKNLCWVLFLFVGFEEVAVMRWRELEPQLRVWACQEMAEELVESGLQLSGRRGSGEGCEEQVAGEGGRWQAKEDG